MLKKYQNYIINKSEDIIMLLQRHLFNLFQFLKKF